MQNIFNSEKIDDVMVLLATKNNNEKSTIVKLDSKSSKITEVDKPQLQNIGLPGICKIGPSVYFIYGGKDNSTKKLLNKCFVYNAKKDTIFRTNNMIKPLFDQFSIKRNNKILAVCGRGEDTQIVNQLWEFCLVKLEWTKLPDIHQSVKGIKKIFLDYQNNLVLITFPNEFIKFDFKQQKWSTIKQFYYDYNRFYISKNNDCYIFNSYHNTLYKYDFYNDQICTIKLLDDFQISDTFYFEELDTILFLDNNSRTQFLSFNCKSEELKIYNEKQYEQLFGQYQCFRAFDNPTLLKKDKIQSIQVGDYMKNKLIIFGNFHSPFQMVIDYDQQSVQMHSIPSDLELKNEQGVLSLFDDKVLFSAGYKDDVSYHQTIVTQVYNVETQEVENMNYLSFQVGDNYLTKLDMVDKQYIVSIAADEIQIMDSEEQKWSEMAQLDNKGYLPCKLDEIDKFIVFFTDFISNDQNTLVFYMYDFQKKNWNKIYEKKIETKITLKFCKKLSQDEYLIIETVDKKEFFTVLKLNWNDKNEIKNVELERQQQICDQVIKSYILDFGFFQNRYLYFIYVKADFSIDFLCYDIKKRKIYNDDKIENINNQILKIFKNMRYERQLWTFNTFGMVTRYNQLI